MRSRFANDMSRWICTEEPGYKAEFIMTNTSLFYAITLCSLIHFAVRIYSHSSKLNNMQKKDLGVLRHENRRDGGSMNKSINPALFSLIIP